jgi:hypothetical protein
VGGSLVSLSETRAQLLRKFRAHLYVEIPDS